MNNHLVNLFSNYQTNDFYCELFGNSHRGSRPDTQAIIERLSTLDPERLRQRAQDAERELYNLGITFTIYTQRDVIDRILPFDVLPRVIDAADWKRIESGVIQRVSAINSFPA